MVVKSRVRFRVRKISHNLKLFRTESCFFEDSIIGSSVRHIKSPFPKLDMVSVVQWISLRSCGKNIVHSY